jgi:sRNA-binding protein
MNIYPQQRYSRETLESWLDHLVRKYPACFYQDPALKRPLKKTLADDLRDESAIDIDATLAYYTRDWRYQASLQAGADRIDLYGKKAGTVTEQEARAATRQVADEKQRVKEKRAAEQRDAVATVKVLHANGHIPDDQLRKIDAPREPAPELERNNPLARLESIMARTIEMLNTGEDKALQSALAVTSLKILVQEAQKVIATLETANQRERVNGRSEAAQGV